jgi:hypothetical protein
MYSDCRLAVFDQRSTRHLVRSPFRHTSEECFEAGPHLPELTKGQRLEMPPVAFFFVLWGLLIPLQLELRGAPLQHPHDTPAVTSCRRLSVAACLLTGGPSEDPGVPSQLEHGLHMTQDYY